MDPEENRSIFPPLSPPFSSGGEFEEVSELPPFNTMPFPPFYAELTSLSASPNFEAVQSQFESKTEDGESLSGVPRPLESLHETSVPAFLSKTFDLVDDPSLDAMISWGAKGNSFVVWDPLEFSRTILPRNFKHNNFSSFVRQLNTYGFRKIDTDKWEFANEGFLRGQRHMLKTIQRRKSIHSQQTVSSCGSSNGARREEIEHLRKERRLMMQEVVELQHQQRGTIQQMEVVKEKLEAAEKRQKQMISFLAKMFQNPKFLARLQETSEQKSIASPRTTRKLVKRQNELSVARELLYAPELAGALPVDPLLKGKSIAKRQPQNTSEYFVSFPEDLSFDKSLHEFSSPRTESMVAEDVQGMGFEASASMSCFPTELWSNLGSSNAPDYGGISDIWDLSSLQPADSSGTDKWPDKDSPPSYG